MRSVRHVRLSSDRITELETGRDVCAAYMTHLGLDFVFTGAVCAILLIFGRQILSLFNENPDVIAYGYLRLEIIFFSFLFSIVQEVLSGYLRGGMVFLRCRR
jgi:Na+-driven multidrug efflux pump